MTVRVTTSDQSQALTRSLAGSQGGSRKDGGDSSFDGLMSNLAGDQAANAQTPAATLNKDAATANASPNDAQSPPSDTTPTSTGLDSSAALGLFSIVTPPSDAIGSWKGTKTKANPASGSKADSEDGGSTQAGSGSISAGAMQQASLLALVQSAAAAQPTAPSPSPAGDPVFSGAASSPSLVSSGSPSPGSGNLVGVSPTPLISGIAFQNYLAPVTPPAGQQLASAWNDGSATPGIVNPGIRPSAASDGSAVGQASMSGPGAAPLATDASAPQTDASPGVALETFVMPMAQSIVGGQKTGTFNPVSSLSRGVSPNADVTTRRSTLGAPARSVAAATAVSNNVSASSQDAAGAPASGSDGAAVGSGTIVSDDTSANPGASDSDKPVSFGVALTNASPQPASATIGTSAIVPATAALPAPIQAVADAVVGLAAQTATPSQASVDSPSRLSPARTMLLQLNPGELGTVSVRLHLTGKTLDVSLTASKDQTADLLDHGRDTLSRTIGDQDYQLNSLVIERGNGQRGDAPSLSGNSNASSADQSRDQGASSSGGNASGSGRQSADGSQTRQDRPDRQPPPRAAPAARGTGLFL